jgi:hypothetical protein
MQQQERDEQIKLLAISSLVCDTLKQTILTGEDVLGMIKANSTATQILGALNNSALHSKESLFSFINAYGLRDIENAVQLLPSDEVK